MKKILTWTVLFTSIICFIALLILVKEGKTQNFDENIMNMVYNLRIPPLNTLFETITYAGSWYAIVGVCLLFLAFDSTRRTYGIPLAEIAIFVTVINKTIKTLIARPRPDDTMWLVTEHGFSFPSGHSVTALAFYGLLIYLIHKNCKDKKKALVYSLLLGVLAISIGLSRIYLGVHYPTDVLGGWLEATFSLLLVCRFALPYQRNCSSPLLRVESHNN